MIRDYENPVVSPNKAGYFLGVVALGGGPLDCSDRIPSGFVRV